MSNGVKYSTTIPSGSLKKGNVALGITGELGPTSTTGFYNMPVPLSGRYIINRVSSSDVPNFFAPQDDVELIRFVKNEGATGGDTGSVAAALAWIATQNNLLATNKVYPDIVTSGSVLNLDAGFVGSYPTTASTWYDLSGYANNGTLINGPSFNPNGYIVFDGVDDIVNLTPSITQSDWSLTSKFQFNVEKIKTSQYVFFTTNSAGTRPGRALLEFTYSATVSAIAVDSSGNIFLGGRIVELNGTRRELIVKLDPSGSVITTFDAGLYITQTQDTTDIKLDSTGSLFYVGYNIGNLTKLNPTTGALVQRISGSVNATITQANVLLDEPNNKVYIGGWFTSIQGRAAQRFARLNLNTMGIDSTFDTTTGFPTEESVQMIALQPDGKVIVGGQFTTYKGSSYNRIIRLNSDASIDTSFNIGTGFNDRVWRNSIAIQPDGKILVGGYFTTYSGSTANRIVRLNNSGSIDTTFNTGVGFNGNVYDIKLQSDGKILVTGEFTSYSGSSASRLIRLNPDGTRDTTYNVGSGVNSAPNTLYLQNDGKVLVSGGYFTSYSGSTVNQVFRTTDSGSLDPTFSVGTGVLGAFRLNTQIIYRDASNVLQTQFFYSITAPTGYDWRAFETASLPLLNRFNEYTLTKDSSNIYRQYWNGQLRNSTTLTTALNTSFDVNRIGTIKGEINTFNVYNKSLSQVEVNQNYYQAPIVTNGLVFAVDAGNLVSYESGSTTTYSLTGSASGSLINGTGFTNNNGGAWNFDGVDDYINIPYSGSTSGSFTFNIIMKCDTMNVDDNNRQTLFGLSQNFIAAYTIFDVEIWGNKGRGFRGNGSFGEGTNFFGYAWTLGVDANDINIYTITLNSTSHTIYVNGQLRDTITRPLTANFNYIILGSRLVGNLWNGSCYYFSMYNRELSSQEVQQNFNAQCSKFGF